MERQLMIKKTAGLLIGVILLVLLVYQSAMAAQYLTDRYKTKFLANRNLDAVIRSADASYGSEFAAYISFLRDAIPEQGAVLIPSRPGSSDPLNDLYLMQYFLFPRRVETCPADCAVRIKEPGIYIISRDGFPPAELLSPSNRLVIFNDTLGLIVPTR
jgi:hypothetical protein